LATTKLSAAGIGITYYPLYDGNGNITSYIDATRTVQAYFNYDPFGRFVTSGNTLGLPFAFSTKPLDPDTGFYYYGYRYYDPVTGRWPSRDPIAERGGLNLYGFVGNNGVNRADYLGKTTTCICAYIYVWFKCALTLPAIGTATAIQTEVPVIPNAPNINQRAIQKDVEIAGAMAEAEANAEYDGVSGKIIENVSKCCGYYNMRINLGCTCKYIPNPIGEFAPDKQAHPNDYLPDTRFVPPW